MSTPAFLRKRLLDPIVALLKQGCEPDAIARSMVIGALVGVIPILGTTTALCMVIALAARLNLVAMQLVNWMIYPLQFALLIPFFRLGAWLFREPPITLQPHELVAMFRADLMGSLQALWTTTWHASVAWLLLGAPVALALYHLLKPLLERYAARQREVSA